MRDAFTAGANPNSSVASTLMLFMAGTGDADRAFRLAARAVQERDPMTPAIMRHGMFDRYRSDSRYAAVTGRMWLDGAQQG